MAGTLAALLVRAAHEAGDASPERPYKLAHTLNVLQRFAPRMLGFAGKFSALTASALAAITRTIKRRETHLPASAKRNKIEPHPSDANMG